MLLALPKILDKFPEQSYTYRVITWAYSSVGSASVSLLCPTELWALEWGVCRLVAQPRHAPKYGPIAQLGVQADRFCAPRSCGHSNGEYVGWSPNRVTPLNMGL